MIEINFGSIEKITVVTADLLGNVTTLTGRSLVYKIYAESDDTETIQVGSIVDGDIDNMTCYPLIDTTLEGYRPGDYNLYLIPTIPPETPILGPVKFRVNSL